MTYRLTKEDFQYMENELAYFRAKKEIKRGMLSRLREIPFADTTYLFNSFANKYDSSPCHILGHQLVHKIVDELIYCGLNKKE